MLHLLQNFVELFVESAPWLLLGFTIAGIIKGFIPEAWLNRQLGGKGAWVTIKAALVGAPLPLCSCGVVPAALGLRKAGASKNATISFLVATPETGIDSIAVTHALMGPYMAVVRPVAAIVSAITAGLMVGQAEQVAPAQADPTSSSCCSSKQSDTPASSNAQRLRQGIRFAYVDMIRDISGWLLLGLLFAAAIKTWVPASLLAEWGSGWSAFILMTLIGVPMYICATASTPIGAGLLMSGVSPGAVLVFMLVGPATNLGTMGIIKKQLGLRSLIAYLTGVISAGYLFGYLTNLLFNHYGWTIGGSAGGQHQHLGGLAIALAIALALLIVSSQWPRLRSWLATKPQQQASGCCCSKQTQPAASSCCSDSHKQQKSADAEQAPSKSCCSSKQSSASAASTGGCCSSDKHTPSNQDKPQQSGHGCCGSHK